ncbi:MAG: type II secretion system protein [Planctomycetota bacterium]
MTRVYKACGFTILELMVVISIIGVLLAMFFAIRPDPSIYVTQSRMQRIQIAVETYHENFYAYPQSFWNGYLDSSNSPQGPFSLPEMLLLKDMRRRDGKYLDPFFDEEDDTEIEIVIGRKAYFLDGWNQRMVYWSGAQMISTMLTDANSPQLIPTWLQLSGKIDASTTIASVAGRYRAEDYYFLGSAGKDGLFGWTVCSSGTNVPTDYSGLAYNIGLPFTNALGAEFEYDDMWNYNLGQK